MKRFVLTATGLLLCILGLYYAVYYGGFYLNLHPDDPVETAVKVEGKEILVKNRKGIYEPFLVRGVDLSSSIPGHNATDYAIEEETWYRWFGQISEMNANTIRIYTIYDDSFYNAFYRFNRGSEKPLYLLQGLQVSDYANHSGKDAYGPEFFASLKKDSIEVIDVLHGRKNIPLNRMKGSGSYRKDISPWVLGYIVGNEWDSGTIAYTNNRGRYKKSWQGTYIRTTEKATAFEAMMAQIMDGMILYETRKYKTQKLVSFQNDPENDPFEFDQNYGKQLGKFNRMNADHLEGTALLQSGYFAAYRLYEFCPDFNACFSEAQKKELAGVLSDLDSTLFYQGYTQLLSRYHSIPVVITGYGFSSARGTDKSTGPLTESEQGQRLVSAYHDIVSSGCSGACITSWQDVWERRTWNTSYATDVQKNSYWHDIQTDGQGYGLLSFDPGSQESVCVIDGDAEEWTEEEKLFTENGISLSAVYDERCLYLLIKKEGMTEQDTFYLPIDVTIESGSKETSSAGTIPKLTFEREADFLLCIQGKEESRMLVQRRYEALRENYLMETEEKDPFVSYPLVDDPDFVPVRMILKNEKLAEEGMTDRELLEVKRFDTWETGHLFYGNGNPTDSGYNSLSDFCYGDSLVEIRIPWQLLNFSNPSEMMIHKDYYNNYGVEWESIQEIYLGISSAGSDKSIPMYPLSLEGWHSQVSYHERKKTSYEIVKQNWSKKDEP